MKRFTEERPLMVRRWRDEVEKHRDRVTGEVQSGCHCLRGPGFMRKRRPYGRCAPSKHCPSCEIARHEERKAVKRRRAEDRAASAAP